MSTILLQRNRLISNMLALVTVVSFSRQGLSEPLDGALSGERLRVIVCTDIGGSDPDDFQSMVHFLMYADCFDIEGLISSPPGSGRKEHILEVIDAYARDLPKLRQYSERFPSAEALQAVTKQGATDPSPPLGFSQPTEGSQWIIKRAIVDDCRPLWVLVWGAITDVAQAIHDRPDIKPKLRVYFISSWNRRMDPNARNYVVENHPDLWLIEAETTFRGMYVGGNQRGILGNFTFVETYVKGAGALGNLFWTKKRDIKMGDSPSVLYLLRGPSEDPTAEHWGGSFIRPDSSRPYWTDNPDPKFKENNFAGAKTVNRWRESFLLDWERRLAALR